MTLTTLKRRREFLRLRGGRRWSSSAFVIECKRRSDPSASDQDGPCPRFGLTVTKKLGNAVTRNRIRRRLRAALEAVAPCHAQPHFDYVVIAREPALTIRFADLMSALQSGIQRLHQPRPQGRRRTGRKPSKDEFNRDT